MGKPNYRAVWRAVNRTTALSEINPQEFRVANTVEQDHVRELYNALHAQRPVPKDRLALPANITALCRGCGAWYQKLPMVVELDPRTKRVLSRTPRSCIKCGGKVLALPAALRPWAVLGNRTTVSNRFACAHCMVVYCNIALFGCTCARKVANFHSRAQFAHGDQLWCRFCCAINGSAAASTAPLPVQEAPVLRDAIITWVSDVDEELV